MNHYWVVEKSNHIEHAQDLLVYELVGGNQFPTGLACCISGKYKLLMLSECSP